MRVSNLEDVDQCADPIGFEFFWSVLFAQLTVRKFEVLIEAMKEERVLRFYLSLALETPTVKIHADSEATEDLVGG